MPIQTALFVGSRVSYSDMANPHKDGTVTKIIPRSRYSSFEQYEVQWDDGTVSTSPCAGPRWNESHVVAPSDEELAVEMVERAIEKEARDAVAAIPVISFSMVETAKLIRAALKAAFPATKFSVRCSRSGGSTGIYWTDGPTTKQVQAVSGEFESQGFDGMQDMRTYADPTLYLADDGSFIRHRYGSGLILEQRDCSPEARAAIEAKLGQVIDGLTGEPMPAWWMQDQFWQEFTKTSF